MITGGNDGIRQMFGGWVIEMLDDLLLSITITGP